MSYLERAKRHLIRKDPPFNAGLNRAGESEVSQRVRPPSRVPKLYNSFNTYLTTNESQSLDHEYGQLPWLRNPNASSRELSMEGVRGSRNGLNELNQKPGQASGLDGNYIQTVNGKNTRVRPWTDDRSWIAAIRHAPDEAGKLVVLAAWVAAYGGETSGQVVLLPALTHHTKRRLSEVELRRMVRQLGLEVLEDGP